LASFAITLSFGSPAHADKITPDVTHAALGAICWPPNIDLAKRSCANAIGYAEAVNQAAVAQAGLGPSNCALQLDGSFYQGEFAHNEYLYLIPYFSSCDAHVDNDGGSLLFAWEHGNFVFKQYLYGLRGDHGTQPSLTDDCSIYHKPSGGDALFCIMDHHGTGVSHYWVTEVTLNHTSSEYEVQSADAAVVAGIASFPDNIICPIDSNQPAFLSLSALRLGPIADTLVFTAEYLDNETARVACSTHKGLIDRKKVKTGNFVYDIALGKLRGSGTKPDVGGTVKVLRPRAQ
jgi:hypothetical protein